MKSKRGTPVPAEQITPADEAEADARTSGPRQVIEQAASDIAHGLQDTDLHGTPSDVPGPVTADSPQAEVPPGGAGTRKYGKRQMGRKAGGN